MKELAGRLAVITGAASGIGRALAVTLAGVGTRLAVTDIDATGLAETERLAGGAAAAVEAAVQLDVADPAGMDRFAAAVADLGGADLLVNNAGISTAGRVGDLAAAYQDWQAQPMRTPEQAAAAILDGIRAKAPRVIIGRDARLMDRLARWLPDRHDWFVDRYLRRGAIWRALDQDHHR